jgi:molecular chaperone DnaK
MKAIGIDLGTTNSVVSVYEKGVATTVNIFNHNLTPSVVSWSRKDKQILVGMPAKKRILIEPALSIVSNKRNMGNRNFSYSILGNKYSPVDITSFLLKYLKDGASATLGESIEHAVITVPAYFNQNQKEDTQRAAEKSGLNVLMLQAEPTAAAIAYGFNQEKDQTILVYDLGGGTFDVSILEVSGNRFLVKAVGGDSFLGGDTFDECILDQLYKDILNLYHIDLKNDENKNNRNIRQQLKEVAENAKIDLSSSKKTDIYIPSLFGNNDFEMVLKRSTYKNLIEKHLEKTIKIIQTTLKEASLTTDDINRVVCVGGSTNNPLVTDIITNALKAPYRAENVDEIVAAGAAITAASRLLPSESNNIKVPVSIDTTNVTPFSLGVLLDDDRFGEIIPKNSPLPITVTKEFTTDRNFTTEIDIVIFQGNEIVCSKNTQLGGFLLKGIQKAKAGIPRIEVNFSLNESDILNIEAKDLSSNTKASLTIEKFQQQTYKKLSFNPYSQHMGKHRITGALTDRFGNPDGSEYDLAKDGSFEGLQIAVLHLCTDEGFDFVSPRKALEEKGFKVHRWTKVPKANDLLKVLNQSCQCWIISGYEQLLSQKHINIINDFFHKGKGVYIWGDNEPYFADSNAVSKRLLNVTMSGDTLGDKIVHLQKKPGKSGFISHLITTGISFLYEGITIATVQNHPQLTPLLYGSAKNIVVSIYDQDGKRAIIDGGFTRLFVNWDSAGTGRYVKNAAAWLVNYERWGEEVFMK